MIHVLLWKELREQWVIWMSLLLATAAGMAGVAALLGSSLNRDETMLVCLMAAALIYGLVCGTQLLAGEAEEGTQPFLDLLPGTRQQLWQSKVVAGFLFVLAQLLAIVVVGYIGNRNEVLRSWTVGSLAMLFFCAFVGFSFGLFSASFCKTVFSAIGTALLLQLIAVVSYYLFVILPFRLYLENSPFDRYQILSVAVFTIISAFVLARSRTIYGRMESLRKSEPVIRARRPASAGWMVLFWLAWNQAKVFFIAALFSGVFTAVVFPFFGLFAWIMLTLLTGILCGVTTFADEQQSGAFRFAGDQRLSPGRVWFVKCLVRFGAGLASITASLLVAGIYAGFEYVTSSLAQWQEFLEKIFPLVAGGNVIVQPFSFIFAWLVTGYAVGLLFGIFFRKPLVAGAVAVAVAYPLAIVWLPSFIVCGSLSAWQVFGVPALLLLTSRLLVRARMADSMFTRRVTNIAVGSGVASAVLLGVALWYRAVEIPVAPDTIDLVAYAGGMPTLEQNHAGRLTTSSLRRLVEIQQSSIMDQDLLNRQIAADRIRNKRNPIPPREALFARWERSATEVANRGWQPANDELGPWLDQMFADEWFTELTGAADEPPGVVIDPRNLTLSSRIPEISASRLAAVLLIARGLQQQGVGHPKEFVDNLRIGLALVRNLRNHTVGVSAITADTIENEFMTGVRLWLEKPIPDVTLVERARDILERHVSEIYDVREECRAAGLLVVDNSIHEARNLVSPETHSLQRDRQSLRAIETAADLVRFSIQVPWENIRLTRLLNALASTDPTASEFGRSHSSILVDRVAAHELRFFKSPEPSERELCRVRVGLLVVALRLYQTKRGKPAEHLDDLVPGFLREIPLDPYDHQPFRYRVSRGETLQWPVDPAKETSAAHAPDGTVGQAGDEPSPTRRVPAGQGILWSVGEDRQDNGGLAQESRSIPGTGRQADAIFLVPLPPAKQ